MKRAFGKRIAWALVIVSSPVLLVFSCGLLLFLGPDCAHRSDRAMDRNFFEHRADFERLVRVFLEDSTLTEGPYLSSWSPPGMTKGERERYFELYRRLGIRKIEREGGVVLLRATTTHTFDRKGYAWCDQPVVSVTCGPSSRPRRTLASAGVVVNGETTRKLRDEFRVFRPIAPGWYLYFQSNS